MCWQCFSGMLGLAILTRYLNATHGTFTPQFGIGKCHATALTQHAAYSSMQKRTLE